MPSPLALPFLIVLASLCAVVFLLALASLLVSAALLQGSHSQTETHTRGERVRRKIANREGRASSIVVRRPLSGLLCLWEMGRMACCVQVSPQSVRHSSRCETRKAALATRQRHSQPSGVLASSVNHYTCWKLSRMARLGASKRAAGRALRPGDHMVW